jgi:hypothetical protein
VGVPLAVCLFLLYASFPLFAFGGIAIYMALLVGGTELAQWYVLRTHYFGSDGATPFYAVGFRLGIGGVLALALVAQYLSGPTISALGVAAPVAAALAIVLLEGVGAILSLPATGDRPTRRGGPISGIPIAAIGFFLLGYSASFGPAVAITGAALVAAGALWLYRSIAPPVLSKVSLLAQKLPGDEEGQRLPSAYGRTRP